MQFSFKKIFHMQKSQVFCLWPQPLQTIFTSVDL